MITPVIILGLQFLLAYTFYKFIRPNALTTKVQKSTPTPMLTAAVSQIPTVVHYPSASLPRFLWKCPAISIAVSYPVDQIRRRASDPRFQCWDNTHSCKEDIQWQHSVWGVYYVPPDCFWGQTIPYSSRKIFQAWVWTTFSKGFVVIVYITTRNVCDPNTLIMGMINW